MFRTSRVLLWIALSGLIVPAAARADAPAAWPVLPVSTSASTAEPTPTSMSSMASQISYEQDDSVGNAPQPDEPPASITSAPSSGSTAATNACESCVKSCCNCMGDCRNRCFFVGVEAALLAPITNHGGGGASYNLTTGAGSNTYTTNSVNGMIVTPRIWMGVMGECWGVGVRYWRYDNSNGGGTITNPNAGGNQGLFSQNSLRLQTLDVEAIRRVCCCNHQVWLSGGFRYGQFVRNGSISGADAAGGTLFTGSAWTGTGFNGIGPTVALYGWRPIGCGGCWNLFYGGRISYLWSDNSSAVAGATATLGSAGGSAGSANAGVCNGGSANAFVGEANLGVQYNHALKCFPAIAFFRVAGEYQYWHVNNDFSATVPGTFASSAAGTMTTMASTGNSTLGLLGFGISTGFMW